MKEIKRAFATGRKRIGMPELRFHDLRHTVASWLLNEGYTLKMVQTILGGTQITTTARYAHLEKGATAEAMSRSLGKLARRRPDAAEKEEVRQKVKGIA
ncbi:tyrosine-type recombinase/integrase [Arenibaculum sp.]|jgi:integrase|uniref:tyrosine-type recombinase/integrase n=1 Tax=Arenibaculum sp. TaxID=2865862 RepID=UPI002E15CD57|nr:tyrosine-type recombinase/integrase [Arenibaculum sp.]